MLLPHKIRGRTNITFDITSIKNGEGLRSGLIKMERNISCDPWYSKGDEAEALSILIEKYEDENYPIGRPDPIVAIKFRMEQMNMK